METKKKKKKHKKQCSKNGEVAYTTLIIVRHNEKTEVGIMFTVTFIHNSVNIIN